jgi:hypothetical protein
MKFFKTIILFGVAVDVSGYYEPAEPPTRDYPGDSSSVTINTYEIGGTDVSKLIDTANWYEEAERITLATFQQ